jgi:Ino eighty subunit 2
MLIILQNETINRLLRKQSSRRNKRNALATAEDKDAGSQAGSDEDAEEIIEDLPEPPAPTMFRWISSARLVEEVPNGIATRATSFTFAVPQSLDPATRDEARQAMASQQQETARRATTNVIQCAVAGCSAPRKYRLVKNWTSGACGLGHLKVLEGRA